MQFIIIIRISILQKSVSRCIASPFFHTSFYIALPMFAFTRLKSTSII